MRVLTVGNMYPPHHFGGYEQVWKSAVEHLRGRGHDVGVLATDFRHPDGEDVDEPNVHRVLRWYWRDHEFANVAPRERLRIERHNRRQLSHHLEQRPDVVSFWSMGGMSHSLIEQVRRSRVPMAAFVHDTWLNYGPYVDQWMRIFYGRRRWMGPPVALITRIPTSVDYGRAGRYVFVSDYVRRRALDAHDLPDTAVAHSGIDPNFIDPVEEHEWRWRLLYVGRLHPDKGIHDVARALLELPDEATVTFAGSWDPRKESALRELVEELGVTGRVTILGHVGRERLKELYRGHDALLSPARWEEPWGLVPLEAMGSGCPVIATGRGGSGEYLRDGENCLLVPVKDPSAIAEAVDRLASERALRERLRLGGFELAPRHTEVQFNAAVMHHLLEMASHRDRELERSSRIPG